MIHSPACLTAVCSWSRVARAASWAAVSSAFALLKLPRRASSSFVAASMMSDTFLAKAPLVQGHRAGVLQRVARGHLPPQLRLRLRDQQDCGVHHVA